MISGQHQRLRYARIDANAAFFQFARLMRNLVASFLVQLAWFDMSPLSFIFMTALLIDKQNTTAPHAGNATSNCLMLQVKRVTITSIRASDDHD